MKQPLPADLLVAAGWSGIPTMQGDSWEPHLEEGALERYAMGRAQAVELQAVEEHLLICGDCQSRLETLETWLQDFRGAAVNSCASITVVHATDAGPVYLQAGIGERGRWAATFKGRELEGADLLPTRESAFLFLRRCFAEMFPRHRCGPGCRIVECKAAPEPCGPGAA